MTNHSVYAYFVAIRWRGHSIVIFTHSDITFELQWTLDLSKYGWTSFRYSDHNQVEQQCQYLLIMTHPITKNPAWISEE